MAAESSGSCAAAMAPSVDRPDSWRVAALAATLDHEHPPWPDGEMPPLGHWLCFRPLTVQSNVGVDGHPKVSAEIADVAGLRRMWAGSEVDFVSPVALGTEIERTSEIRSIERKSGRTGPLVFVTVEHRVEARGTLAIAERQHIVYREPAPADALPPGEPAEEGDWQREVRPDPVLLQRYSALTFNSHRIHYDFLYATTVEHYRGLVVHGPLTATLLMDLFLRNNRGARVSKFRFRAQRPLFAGHPMRLQGRATAQGADLWAMDHDGYVAMKATVETR